jgi:hypothetical protein
MAQAFGEKKDEDKSSPAKDDKTEGKPVLIMAMTALTGLNEVVAQRGDGNAAGIISRVMRDLDSLRHLSEVTDKDVAAAMVPKEEPAKEPAAANKDHPDDKAKSPR